MKILIMKKYWFEKRKYFMLGMHIKYETVPVKMWMDVNQ